MTLLPRLYRILPQGLPSPSSIFHRTLTTKKPPFPTIPTCPSPTCPCTPTPEGLDIDRTSPLNGVMPVYAQQVLICTGRDDWASKIEEENEGRNLANDLKRVMGRGGRWCDPFHNVSPLNTSLPSSPPPANHEESEESTSVYILPQFKYIPFVPSNSPSHLEALVRGFLLPDRLHPAHDGLSPDQRDLLTRKPEFQSQLRGVRDVKDVMILICGHGGRDERCGVYGPLLRDEFRKVLPGKGVEVLESPVRVEREAATTEQKQTARVGLVSHVGGHKFAGNVIVYVPPGARTIEGGENPLEGCGIWYGRVEPRHVEGIVEETVMRGKVIEELFRGGINRRGEILRI